jgi:hypothetical protein
MFWRRKRFIGLSLLGAMFAVWMLSQMEVVILHARDRVTVSAIPTKPDLGENLVAVLDKGQSTQVLSCEDIKEPVYRVRLGSGQEGYVRGGNYFLEQQNISLSNLDKVTFSCKKVINRITSSCKARIGCSEQSEPQQNHIK